MIKMMILNAVEVKIINDDDDSTDDLESEKSLAAAEFEFDWSVLDFSDQYLQLKIEFISPIETSASQADN